MIIQFVTHIFKLHNLTKEVVFKTSNALSNFYPPFLNTLSFCMYYQPFLLFQPFDIRSKPKESYKWSPRRKRRHLLKGSDIYWAITGTITVPFRVMTKSPLNTHINSLSLAEQLRIEGDLFFLPLFPLLLLVFYYFWEIDLFLILLFVGFSYWCIVSDVYRSLRYP